MAELYVIPIKGDAYPIGEIRKYNARAFYELLSPIYMGKEYHQLTYYQYKSPSPFDSDKEQKAKIKKEKEATEEYQFWKIYKNPKMPVYERILLLCTYNRAVVRREDLPRFIAAIKTNMMMKNTTVFSEYIPICEKLIGDETVFGVYWQYDSDEDFLATRNEINQEELDEMIQKYLKDRDAHDFMSNVEMVYYTRRFNYEKDKDHITHFFPFQEYADLLKEETK